MIAKHPFCGYDKELFLSFWENMMATFLKSGGHYAIVGLGASGLSALHFLHDNGYTVSATDAGNPTVTLPSDVATYFGELNGELLQSVDGIVISPGVNPAHPAIVNAKAKGVPVVSDVQLAVDICHEKNIPIVAITGSNAKSTVTTLVGEIAKNAGIKVGVGGNLGTPALELVKDDIELCVLELSSFQLEHITNLNAKVATILNLSPDHLDRHGDMATYLRAKLTAFDGADSVVLFGDDENLLKDCQTYLNTASPNANIATVTANAPQMGEFGLIKENDEFFLAKGNDRYLSANALKIKGVHNLTNALFVLAIGDVLGIDKAVMLDTLREFAGLPHRCQFVASVNGVDYFNDSKGTNIGATLSAIVGLGQVYGEKSLVLVLGGVGKGQDFTELADFVERFGASVLTIGQDGELIENQLKQANVITPIIPCGTLDKAVEVAKNLSAQGQGKAVLLSPACASLDQFKNYNERGDRFVELVKA